jgi:hypothetical protein
MLARQQREHVFLDMRAFELQMDHLLWQADLTVPLSPKCDVVSAAFIARHFGSPTVGGEVTARAQQRECRVRVRYRLHDLYFVQSRAFLSMCRARRIPSR